MGEFNKGDCQARLHQNFSGTLITANCRFSISFFEIRAYCCCRHLLNSNLYLTRMVSNLLCSLNLQEGLKFYKRSSPIYNSITSIISNVQSDISDNNFFQFQSSLNKALEFQPDIVCSLSGHGMGTTSLIQQETYYYLQTRLI